MQLVNLATGALDKVDMSGMQWVDLTEYDTDRFLLPGKLKPLKTVQRLQLLRAGAFDFGIQ